jgi:hypothetical protein
MVVGFEGAPSGSVAGRSRPPGRPGSVAAAAIIVWFYAFFGTLLGLGIFTGAEARYPYRNGDMVIGVVIAALSFYGNVPLGVLLLRGSGWAWGITNVLAAFCLAIEIYIGAARVAAPPILLLAALNLILLVLLNNSQAWKYFAAARRWRTGSRRPA